MGLQRFERRLERLVEGTINKAFKGGLQPLEIGRRVVREMDGTPHARRARPGRAERVHGVPLARGRAALRRVPRDALARELEDAAREHARDEGYGVPRRRSSVAFEIDERRRRGDVDVRGDDRRRTRRAHRCARAPRRPPADRSASTRCASGGSPTAAIALSDPQVSRHHAEVRAAREGFEVVDLGSTNGTMRQRRRREGTRIARRRRDPRRCNLHPLRGVVTLTMSEGVLTVLKFCLLALLYLFLARVVWVVGTELAARRCPRDRRPNRPPPRAGAAARAAVAGDDRRTGDRTRHRVTASTVSSRSVGRAAARSRLSARHVRVAGARPRLRSRRRPVRRGPRFHQRHAAERPRGGRRRRELGPRRPRRTSARQRARGRAGEDRGRRSTPIIGRIRDGNEDSFVVDERLALFAVADGMGGHRGGEVASATAVEALRAAIAGGQPVEDAVKLANRAVLERAAQRPRSRRHGHDDDRGRRDRRRVVVAHRARRRLARVPAARRRARAAHRTTTASSRNSCATAGSRPSRPRAIRNGRSSRARSASTRTSTSTSTPSPSSRATAS